MLHKTTRLLLCLLMILSLAAAFPVSAENDCNVSYTISATEVAVGDTVTVTLSNREMSVICFCGTIYFDKTLFTCESITGVRDGQTMPNFYMYDIQNEEWTRAMVISSLEDSAKAGTVGFAFVNTEESHYAAGTVFEATFRAKADGMAEFYAYEDSDGTGGTKNTRIDPISVKVGTGIASEPPETADPSDPANPTVPTATAVPFPQETASPADKTNGSPLKTVLWIGIPSLVAAGAVAVLLVLKKKKKQ